MPKKVRNAFYFYMLEWKQTEEAKGRRFPGGLAEVGVLAGEFWKELPAPARAKYEAQAKGYKSQGGHVRKYTSLGECLDDVQRREEGEKRARDAERADIKRIVGTANVANTLCDTVFFLIDVNFYCETTDRFVINEVSLISFTVADGLGSFVHKIVDPVAIPTGFASDAKESFEVHNFPLPPLSDGESDLIKIFSQIMAYLEDFKTNQVLPPLFTHPDRLLAVRSFLQQLCDYCGEDIQMFRLYQLHQLLYDMTAALRKADNEGLPTEALALTELKKDPFQYHLHLACEFHEGTEVHHNCTLSRVKRWAFTVLDYCCLLAGVPMVPGCHLPKEIDEELVAQVKERHEAEREEARRADRPFRFVDWSLVPEAARPRDPRPAHAPPPVAFARDDFPSLGGPPPAKGGSRLLAARLEAFRARRAWSRAPLAATFPAIDYPTLVERPRAGGSRMLAARLETFRARRAWSRAPLAATFPAIDYPTLVERPRAGDSCMTAARLEAHGTQGAWNRAPLAASIQDGDYPTLSECPHAGASGGAIPKRAPLRVPEGDAGGFGCFGRGRGSTSAWGPKN